MGMIGNSPALGVVTPAQLSDAELQSLAAMSPSRATYLAGTEGFGFRNRIINGDMRIDQRNAGAAVTIASGGGYIFPVDRFASFNNTGANYTAEQVEDAPTGFYQSTKLTFGSAISLTTQNEATFFQIIEGVNVSDFGWGAAGAQAITVGKWVKASFTGTFSIGFCNDGGARVYATTYTINAANTWEYKTFTIPGDTSGTWLKTNGGGLYVRWNIIAGSNFQVAANNAWATRTGAYNAADGIYGTKAVGAASSISAGATWQITGVQLEAGTVATPFERRDYGREFELCRRYCRVIRAGDSYSYFGPLAVFETSTNLQQPYPVDGMRTSALSWTKSGSFQGEEFGGGNLGVAGVGLRGSDWVRLNWTGSGVAGQVTAIRSDNDISAKMTLDCEL